MTPSVMTTYSFEYPRWRFFGSQCTMASLSLSYFRPSWIDLTKSRKKQSRDFEVPWCRSRDVTEWERNNSATLVSHFDSR